MRTGSGARWARLNGMSVVPLTEAESAQILLGAAPLHERIALTTFPWGTSVSTLFTGMRYGGDDGRPALWFQTVVLAGGDDLTKQHWRHASYAEAIAGHYRVIDAVLRERWGRAWQAVKQDEAGGRGRVAAGY